MCFKNQNMSTNVRKMRIGTPKIRKRMADPALSILE